MLVTTPTGQTIIVPDDFGGFAPPQQIDVGEYGAPVVPSTVPSAPLPQPVPTPFPTLPSAPQSIPITNPFPGMGQPVQPPPPGPIKRIGPNGVVEETAGPVPAAQTIPSAFPGGIDAQPAPNMEQGRVPIVPNAAELAQQVTERTKAEKQAQQAAARDAAFRATAEGKIQTAGEQEAQAIENQGAVINAQGDVEARKAAAEAAVKQQGVKDLAAAQAEVDRRRAAREQGINQHTKTIEDLQTREANFKIDDNRRWHNLSTGRKLLAGISVALSGLGDALMRKSGPNAAMGIINEAIKDDVAAQVREREHLGQQIGYARNSLDDYYKMTGSWVQAAELKVGEEEKRIAQQIDATAAQYGSPLAKLRAEAAKQQLFQQGAATRYKIASGIFDRDQARQAAADRRAQVGIAGGHLALAQRAQAFNERMQKAELLAKLSKEVDDAGGIGGDVTTAVDDKGNPTQSVKPLMQNGKVWKPAEKDRELLIAERNGTQQLYDTLRQIQDLRDKVGGASRKFSPTDQAEYDRLTNKAIIAYAQTKHISLADEQSQKFARDAILGADPSEFNLGGVADRIQKTLTEETNNYHTHLQSAGYKGPLPKFVDVGGAPKAPKTPDEDAFQDLLKGVNEFHDGKRIQRELGQQLTARPGSTEWNQQIGQAIAQSGGVYPSQLQTMRNIYSLATTSTDAKVRDQNLQFLTTAANSAPDKNVRALAQSFLDQVQAKGIAEMPTGAPQPGQRTVRDTVAAPPGQ